MPEELIKVVLEIATISDNTPPMDRYRKAVEEFASGKSGPMMDHFKAVGEKLLAPILGSMQSGGLAEPKVVEVGDGSVVIGGIIKKEKE